MNIDAIVMLLFAIADLAMIVHLRKYRARKARAQRMMASLRLAVLRENGVEELVVRRSLLRAS